MSMSIMNFMMSSFDCNYNRKRSGLNGQARFGLHVIELVTTWVLQFGMATAVGLWVISKVGFA